LTKNSLWISLATSIMLLACAAMGLRVYALRHFLPEQKMRLAVGAGDQCIAIFGDSRMDAATDLGAFHSALRATNADRCLAPLALGATDISGIVLTAREYLHRGPHPDLVVIGKVGDSLLGGFEPLRPEGMVGNNAIHLLWSRPSDVFE
jgi:hypothetical protein